MADDSGATVAARPIRRRVVALGALLLTVGAGLAVYLLAPDVAASDIAGDALYAVAVYLAVVILLPRRRVVVTGLLAAVWCVGVELFQLIGVPLALGAVFPPIMLVLGTVFDARDIVVYLVTIVAVAVVDSALRASRRVRA
ncbi:MULTISPECIES: ribosomal maturation YjgA family protein [Bacteria]